jgi:hypothetical protein
MKKYIAAVAASIVLTACGGGSDSKDLFSLWKSEQTGAPLDLSASQFGSDNLLNAYTADGTRCICDLAIIGEQSSGTIAVTGCISIPYNADRNPQCVALNGGGTYSKTSDVLTVNRNGGTGTFR